jgi:hypothetical protein
MKPIKCCGYYCCVFLPPDESEYPKIKLKKNLSIKFDEVMQKKKIDEFNRSLADINVKIIPDEIKIEKHE